MTSEQDKRFLESVGQRIKLARRKLKMSQGDLATAIGKTQNVISRYEMGSHAMGINELPKIAAALGVPSSYLLGESPIEEDLDLVNTFLMPFLRITATTYLIRNLRTQYAIAKSYMFYEHPEKAELTKAVKEVEDLMEDERGKLVEQLKASSEKLIHLRQKLQRRFKETDWVRLRYPSELEFGNIISDDEDNL